MDSYWCLMDTSCRYHRFCNIDFEVKNENRNRQKVSVGMDKMVLNSRNNYRTVLSRPNN